MRSTLVGNLRFAARELEGAGIKLLVEPINAYDIPGFYLSRTDQTLALFDEVGERNLWLQYDIYHMQRMRGRARRDHRQASRPHRRTSSSPTIPAATSREPARSTTTSCSAVLDELGYDGWIGCEYKPRTTTLEGLGWLARAAMRA